MIIWSKFAFFKRTQLGPDNNPYLDQIVTPQNAILFEFFAFKTVPSTYFYFAFWKSTTIGKKWPKTITLHILQNTGY